MLWACHGNLDAVHEHAERERVEGGADSLVQDQLDEGVADVELGLHKLVLACLAVQLLLIIGGGRSHSVLSGRDLVRGEALFEEALPIDVLVVELANGPGLGPERGTDCSFQHPTPMRTHHMKLGGVLTKV